KIGIAQKLSAIEESAAEGLYGQMDRIGRSVPHAAEIVAFQDIKSFHHGDSARAGRRSADDFVATVRSPDGLPFFDFILSEVLRRDQPAAALHVISKLLRHGAFVKVIRLCGDPLQRACQLWLAENVTRLVIIAIALK